MAGTPLLPRGKGSGPGCRPPATLTLPGHSGGEGSRSPRTVETRQAWLRPPPTVSTPVGSFPDGSRPLQAGTSAGWGQREVRLVEALKARPWAGGADPGAGPGPKDGHSLVWPSADHVVWAAPQQQPSCVRLDAGHPLAQSLNLSPRARAQRLLNEGPEGQTRGWLPTRLGKHPLWPPKGSCTPPAHPRTPQPAGGRGRGSWGCAVPGRAPLTRATGLPPARTPPGTGPLPLGPPFPGEAAPVPDRAPGGRPSLLPLPGPLRVGSRGHRAGCSRPGPQGQPQASPGWAPAAAHTSGCCRAVPPARGAAVLGRPWRQHVLSHTPGQRVPGSPAGLWLSEPGLWPLWG